MCYGFFIFFKCLKLIPEFNLSCKDTNLREEKYNF